MLTPAAGCDDEGGDEPLSASEQAQWEAMQREMARDAEAFERSAGNMDTLAIAMRHLEAAGKELVTPGSPGQLGLVFPPVEGWARAEIAGVEETVPYAFSRASCTYTASGASVQAELTDSGNNPLLTMPFAMLIEGSEPRVLESGFERPRTVGGHPAWEVWSATERTLTLQLIVSGRFLLTLQGSGLPSAQAAEPIVQSLALQKLDAITSPSTHEAPSTGAQGAAASAGGAPSTEITERLTGP